MFRRILALAAAESQGFGEGLVSRRRALQRLDPVVFARYMDVVARRRALR